MQKTFVIDITPTTYTQYTVYTCTAIATGLKKVMIGGNVGLMPNEDDRQKALVVISYTEDDERVTEIIFGYDMPKDDEAFEAIYKREAKETSWEVMQTIRLTDRIYYCPDRGTGFGDSNPVCISWEDVNRLSHEEGWENIWDEVHEATPEEIEYLGICDD